MISLSRFFNCTHHAFLCQEIDFYYRLTSAIKHSLIKEHTRKNDFAEESKILLDTVLKIILSDHQDNFVEILKIMNKAANNFDILATSLSVLQNCFDCSTKLFF